MERETIFGLGGLSPGHIVLCTLFRRLLYRILPLDNGGIVEDEETKIIEIYWNRSEIDYNPYERWVDYWNED
ncbi:MAG: ThaI family type II restriction endonuclease [Candidatus Poribacteria bacterium]